MVMFRVECVFKYHDVLNKKYYTFNLILKIKIIITTSNVCCYTNVRIYLYNNVCKRVSYILILFEIDESSDRLYQLT